MNLTQILTFQISFMHFKVRTNTEKTLKLSKVEYFTIFFTYTAAERARAEYPELDWLHLVCLIHDM